MVRRGTSGINALLGVDKPAGMTSHDVVDSVRRAVGERRVGHAGTLDPAATGVMVVGIGQGTRLMGLLTADTKSYVAQIVFGFETDTDDGEGVCTHVSDVGPEVADPIFAQKTLQALVGPSMQVPPAYSAISIGGKRAYARARAGDTVELEPRQIEIFEAILLGVVDDAGTGVAWQCAFTVSKGTYIRALARDIGRSVGSAAHLGQLRRTSSGNVTLSQCVNLSELSSRGPALLSEAVLDPVRALGLRAYRVDAHEEKAVRSGMQLPTRLPDDERVCMVSGRQVLGVWESRGGCLRPVANFPAGIDGVAEKA